MITPTPELSALATEKPSAADEARWFAVEVYPHESSLRSYLKRAFPSVRDTDDVVQESYLRILRRQSAESVRCARALLFTVAQRIAVDLLRRDQVSPVDRTSRLADLSVAHEGPDAAAAAERQERVEALAAAVADLPARCREVFILHKIRGFSRKEVASRLGLAEKTVEVQTSRATRRCAEFLRRRGVDGLFSHASH